MNPSWKIDELARHVLRTAQWPGLPLMPAAETPSSNTLGKASSTLNNSVGVPITPTPHLDELERALEIYLGPLRQCPGNHGGDSGDGNIRTCTAPNRNSNGGDGAAGKRATGKTGDANGTWTWTPQPENANNSYTKPSDALANAVDLNDVTTLEELAPFRPEFYRALGELAREAFHPGSVKLDTNALDGGVNDAKITEDTSTSSSGTGSHHDKVRSYQALYSIEQYSLPRMHDAYRITRVLLAMQDLHVSDTERDVSNSDEVTFLERLLHYCEGNGIAGKNTNSTNENATGEESGATVRGKRIPILSAFFHHWSRLPQMEHSTQQLSRKYTSLLPMNASDYWEYCKYADGENDRGDNNKSWKESSLPSTVQSTTSFLGARSLRIDWLKQRLEDELQSHVNGGGEGGRDRRSISANANLPEHGGLVTLLSMLYRYSDATLRGKCRRWMGQWLRSFAIGSGGSSSYSTMRGMDSGGGGVASGGDAGLGPSFLAFCPLIAVSSFGGGNSTGSDAGSSGMMMATGPISITHMQGGGGGMPHNPLGMENTSACGIEALLKVLLRIIMGFGTLQSSDGTVDSVMTDASKDMNLHPRRSDVLRPSHENLLFDVLLPLHRPSGMVLWRDQTPLIGLYHEALVKCIGVFLTLDRTLVGPVVGALLHPDIWPTEGGARRSASNSGGAVGNAASANTPKVVLLLHEVDTLVSLLSTGKESEEQQEHNLSSFDPHLIPLTLRLCACISSENSRTSERALQFFKNKTFQRLVRRRLNDVGSHFLRALCRCPAGTSDDSGSNSLSDGFEIPWNPTVRKMTLLVLKELEGYYTETSSDIGDNDAFDRACEEAFCGGSLLGEEEKKPVVNQNKVAKKQETTGTAMIGTRPNDSAGTLSSDMTTLRGAMGSWRPPTSKSKTSLPSSVPQRGTQPPLTVTGVAPWAVGNRNPAAGKLGVERGSANVKQPPLTITGVAPWAINKQTNVPTSSKPSYHKPAPLPKRRGQPLPPAIVEDDNAIAEEEEVELEADENIDMEVSQNIMSPALRKVRSYMDRLRPPDGEEDNSDGISSWAKAQMEESPVLLQNLKFHDLVFGQELGTGAFSTVKYARQILKDRTRSSWPEFAVKIVSTQKIDEMGYEQSINREIAILRTMSHPGIARLISSFRFRDGAYLVLEYSSGGDLHTLLKKNGSLDHESTRFVIGSAAAAIWHIHQRGFVYADFKPENILITESGHIKVTDFGACRPVTEEAKALVKLNSKNLLQQLRDGDWKPNKLTSSGGNDFDAGTSDAGPSGEDEEDLRIEGTTAYLPPEVVIGGFPTPAADVWAIGCVLFQCISGRPPLLEDTDDLTAQRIVTFHLGSSTDDFFGQCDLSSFRDDAKALIRRILTRDAAARPDVPGIANDDFFEGVDIFSLHKKPAHPLDVGSVAPVSDAKWSRRQFSSIWAPQPQAYVIGGDLKQSSSKQNNSLSNPILEGDEADIMFSSATKAPLLGKIRELD